MADFLRPATAPSPELLALQAGLRPWAWGRDDCTLWLAPYVAAVSGRDVAAPYLGAYDDEAGAQRILAAAGGLTGLLGRILPGAGMVALPEAEARQGDIGVVPALLRGDDGSYRRGEVTAYCQGGPRWLIRTGSGIASVRARPIAVWGWR